VTTDGGSEPGVQLGDWLRQARAAAGMTQEELADRSGVAIRAIGDLERGRTRQPYARSIRLLAAALAVPFPGRLAGPAAVPRQLPAPVRHFTGRRAELDTLTGMLGRAGRPAGPVLITAIGGMAGMGKTALAVRWAHQIADRFPDGQLYVNLRGFDPSGRPMAAAEAICGVLEALGVPPERIPVGLDALANLYRSLLAGKQMLVLLDNARDPDQVRPLLPGAPGCLVLVTSRAELTGLAALDGAHLLTLDLPTQQEARTLLAAHLGARRVAAEQAAAGELITLCARLPLALGIVAARAAAHPSFPLTALAAELRDTAGRLDALDTGQTASSVRAVFSWSCQQLSEPAARLFRLLGLHPGPDIGAAAAASLACVPPPAARTALHALARAGLITELAPGRYAMHDLLRVYAAELATSRDLDTDHQAAAGRMLGHYLHTADTAACLLDPLQQSYVSHPPAPGVTPEVLTDHDQALAWFAAERNVLLALTEHAARTGYDTHAQQLSWILVTYLDWGGHWSDMTASAHLALACSQRLGDLRGQAHAHRNLARAHLRQRQAELARTHLTRAARLARRAGDQAGESEAYLRLSAVFEGQQRPREALRSSLRALELAKSAGSPALTAMACNNAGYLYARLGDPRNALAYCQQAQREHSRLGGPSTLQASICDSLGYAYRRLGEHDQATHSYQRAADLFGELGARRQQAKTLSNLGDAYHAAGDVHAARQSWQQALTILIGLDHPDASLVRAKLRDAQAHHTDLPRSVAQPDMSNHSSASEGGSA
jgi:transcriptional regulator with XRE-family HTH domain/tetratricopeptide (TPR) repeat protein